MVLGAWCECSMSAGVAVVGWFGRSNGWGLPNTARQVACRRQVVTIVSDRLLGCWLVLVVSGVVALTCGGVAHCPPAVGAGGQWWPILSAGVLGVIWFWLALLALGLCWWVL